MAFEQFPNAIKTFSAYVENQPYVYVGNNPTPAPASGWIPYATQLSINLKEEQSMVAATRGGDITYSSAYIGTTFDDTPIQLGDILKDESEFNRDGSPIYYQVMGKSIYAITSKLRLRRYEIGELG